MEKLIKVNKYCYLIALVGSAILLCLNNFFVNKIIVAIGSILLGIVIVMKFYKDTNRIISPITIFAAIWFTLVGITSFNFPLMDAMTTWEWNITIIFSFAFTIGGLIISFIIKPNYSKIKEKNDTDNGVKINDFKYLCFIFLIIIGILVHVYQTIKFGGFVILSDNPSADRNEYSVSGLGSLSTLGTLGIFGVFVDKKYRKKTASIFLSLVYLFFLLVEGVRFQIFLTILLCVGSFTNIKINRRYLLAGLICIISLILIFNFIATIRQNSTGAYLYYIQTGIYSGDASDITKTEIFRYFGFSQRLTSYYWEQYKPGVSFGAYTFYPITHTFGINVLLPERIWVLGYVATSWIVYLYCDFGFLWPLAVVILSLIINRIYFNYSMKKNKLLRQYLWSLCIFGLTMSFYSYIDSYIYAILYFPIIILIINICDNTLKQGEILHGKNKCFFD